jgi:hypothetical protein
MKSPAMRRDSQNRPSAQQQELPTRTIQLFDSKYTGSFNTHAERVAFLKGVDNRT